MFYEDHFLYIHRSSLMPYPSFFLPISTSFPSLVDPSNFTPLPIRPSHLDNTNNSYFDPPISPPLVPRHSSCPRQPPIYLKDYHSTFTLTSTSSRGIRHHIVLSYKHLSPSFHHYIMFVSSISEPKSYVEASKFDCWLKAMHAEINATNNTWILTDLPPHKVVIDFRWIYKVKDNVDGTIEHYKVHTSA